MSDTFQLIETEFGMPLYFIVCSFFLLFTIYRSRLILINCIYIMHLMKFIIYKISVYIHIFNTYLLLLILLLSSSTYLLKRSIIFDMIFFWQQIFRFIKYKLFTPVPVSLDIYDVLIIYIFNYEYVGLINKYCIRVFIVYYHTIYITDGWFALTNKDGCNQVQPR